MTLIIPARRETHLRIAADCVIMICGRSEAACLAASAGATHAISFAEPGLPAPDLGLAAERHLVLSFHDMRSRPSDSERRNPRLTFPRPRDAQTVMEFAKAARADLAGVELRLLVHCSMGVSRSTAGAFIAACSLAPTRRADEILGALLEYVPEAMPNPLMVEFADLILARTGERKRRELLGALANEPRLAPKPRRPADILCL